MNVFRPHPEDCNVFLDVGVQGKADENGEPHLQTWDRPWNLEEFLLMASKAGHPAGLESFLPPRMSSCIRVAMNMTVADRMQHRARTLKHWLKQSIELRAGEKDVYDSLRHDVACVLHGKKILLSAIDYEDMDVVSEFTDGTVLTGCAPDEVARDELEGRLSIESIPDHIPLSKRFGVRQGQKTRCVDDSSASQVSESPKPHTLDVVVCLLLR